MRRLQDVVVAEAPVDLQARQAEDQDVQERQGNVQHQNFSGNCPSGLRLSHPRHVDAHYFWRAFRLHTQIRESASPPRRARRSFVRRLS